MTTRQPQSQPLPTEQFRVYEATDPFHSGPFRLALRRWREEVLLAGMECGRKLLRLGRLVLQTNDEASDEAGDEASARRMAQALHL